MVLFRMSIGCVEQHSTLKKNKERKQCGLGSVMGVTLGWNEKASCDIQAKRGSQGVRQESVWGRMVLWGRPCGWCVSSVFSVEQREVWLGHYT